MNRNESEYFTFSFPLSDLTVTADFSERRRYIAPESEGLLLDLSVRKSCSSNTTGDNCDIIGMNEC